MRHLKAVLISVSLLWGTTALAATAAAKVVWCEEAEKVATKSGMHFGTAVAGDASGDRSYWAGNSGAGSFYVGPASGQDSWRGVLYWKKMRRIYFEFFSWAPGDISDLAPAEDLFCGGEGRLVYRSRQTIIQQNRMLRSVGIWPVSYVNGTCWAESGYKRDAGGGKLAVTVPSVLFWKMVVFQFKEQ